MTLAVPPSRPAELFAEHEGARRDDARFWPFWTIASWASHDGITFRAGSPGGANGRVWLARQIDRGSAELAFATDLGDGTILLQVTETGWLRCEVMRDGAVILRAWFDQPYEELEFWPDNSDGEGEPPGRISKRGSWLQIDCARFPGAPQAESGFFQLEDVTAEFA